MANQPDTTDLNDINGVAIASVCEPRPSSASRPELARRYPARGVTDCTDAEGRHWQREPLPGGEWSDWARAPE